MKNVLMIIALAAITFVSCKKDETPDNNTTEYKMEITVNEPADNSAYGIADKVPLNVDFKRGPGEIIHHVKIHLLDSNGDVAKVLLEEHAHVEQTYSFALEQGFSIDNTGSYTIKFMSHDMDGNHADPVEINISAQ